MKIEPVDMDEKHSLGCRDAHPAHPHGTLTNEIHAEQASCLTKGKRGDRVALG